MFTTARTRLQYLHNRRLYTNDYLICLALIFRLVLSILYQVMSPPMYSLVTAMDGLEQITASNIIRFEYYLRLQSADNIRMLVGAMVGEIGPSHLLLAPL